MPFISKLQNAWAHTPSGVKALGGPAKVKEWESATDYSHLPEKVMPEKKKTHWLGGAVRHPGALTAAAKEHSVSKLQEAEKESHSDNPHIRGRGALGVRLIKRTI